MNIINAICDLENLRVKFINKGKVELSSIDDLDLVLQDLIDLGEFNLENPRNFILIKHGYFCKLGRFIKSKSENCSRCLFHNYLNPCNSNLFNKSRMCACQGFTCLYILGDEMNEDYSNTFYPEELIRSEWNLFMTSKLRLIKAISNDNIIVIDVDTIS